MGHLLAWTQQHTWLGLLWRGDLDFEPMVRSRLAGAKAQFATFAGVVESRSLPLATAAEAFEAKVDSYMATARWLWGTSTLPRDIVDEAYDAWARGLLGGAPWRNRGMAAIEIGWFLDGVARALLDIALRTVRLWALPDSQFYKQAFLRGIKVGGRSWASASGAALASHGLPDLPEWGSGGASVED